MLHCAFYFFTLAKTFMKVIIFDYQQFWADHEWRLMMKMLIAHKYWLDGTIREKKKVGVEEW